MENWKSVADSKAMTTSFQVWEMTGIPDNCELGEVTLTLDTIAGGATQVTLYVAHDNQGRAGVTPFQTTGATQTISDVGGGFGFVAFNLGAAWVSESSENPCILAKLNAGTANAIPRLFAKRRSDP